MEEEDRSPGDATEVEESNNEMTNEVVKLSPPSKPKSQILKTADEILSLNGAGELLKPSISNAQLESKESSKDRIDTTPNEMSPRSKSKSKSSKKKKKKIVRNDDSGSNVDLDGSNSGLETTTEYSTTSSKLKSKGLKKKKKRTNAIDDGDSLDIISVSSAKSGLTTRSKSSPKKKKKKKKVMKDDESLDVEPNSMRSDDGAEDDKSTMTSSVKSKSKTRLSKSKKKKSKNLSEDEKGQSNNDEMKRTMSLELGHRAHCNGRRAKSFDDDQPSDFIIKRSMSLDASSAQFRSTPSTLTGKFTSHRESGIHGNNWSGRGRAHGGRGRGPTVGGRGRGRGRGPPPAGWAAARPQRPPERMHNGERRNDGRSYSQERSVYGVRGVSQERMPYGNRSASQERSSYGPRAVSQERPPYSPRGASQERSPYSPRSASQERPPYGPRSASQERSPYNTRVANGRGFAPSQRGRRRMSFPPPSTHFENPESQARSPRSTPPLQSKPSRGNVYRAPSRPKSILRNSSHHGTLHGSSHHRNDRSIATVSSHSSQYNRHSVSVNLSAGSTHSYNPRGQQSSFRSEMDSSDVESDDDTSFAMEDNDRSFNMDDSNKIHNKQVPKTVVRGYSRTLSGLGINSSHHAHMMKCTGQSARSLLTIERSEFQNENRFVRFLRYIHFLAPHPDEDPIKKKIRIVTWTALILDLINALVAIATYGGTTTQCCGRSIMSAFGGKVDWDRTILIVTCLYILLIFLEVVPVMRDAFPFNLLNPFIGFVITFAVFFSDSITESAVMWSVEMLAVLCEVINYRLRLKRFGKRKARLKNTKQEIEKLRKLKRKVKDQYDKGGGRILTRAESAQFVLDLNDSSSFAEDSSFFDDIETQNNSGDVHTVASRTAITTVSNIGTARETRLLRERRQLIRSQQEDELDLRYHFAGACFNVSLVVLSLLMLVLISKNGGMCIKGMSFGNIFRNNQLVKCNKCDGSEVCEHCIWDDTDQTILSEDSYCYYPYGLGM